ncbi:hypothetical protein KCMC57_up04470 [Kitasatospora sp. CMC57]|uniref:Secreted protein n=1 Tax=Kitasatospora sp. CMC57 TaxID=3231513 RepID=A0AB33JU17_9ACTN
MNKRMARTVATVALTAGIVAVPAAGTALADSPVRGAHQHYNHQVHASTSNVSYDESTTYHSSSSGAQHSHGSSGHHHGHGQQHYHGLLGLGLLGL